MVLRSHQGLVEELVQRSRARAKPPCYSDDAHGRPTEPDSDVSHERASEMVLLLAVQV